MITTVVRSIRAVAAIAVIAVAAAPAAAQTPASAHGVAGTWTLGLEGGDHVIPVGLTLEQHGDALTGTLAMMGKNYPVSGSLQGQTLALTGQGALGFPGQQAPVGDVTIAGTADAGGTFAGTFTLKTGERLMAMKYTAERLRERKTATATSAGAPPASVAGDWTVTIVEASLTMKMTLAQEGDKVTGTATSDHLGAMTLAGTFVNGTLAFVTTGKNNGQDIRIEYTGTPRANGEFAGDLSSPMGAMTWTSARVRP